MGSGLTRKVYVEWRMTLPSTTAMLSEPRGKILHSCFIYMLGCTRPKISSLFTPLLTHLVHSTLTDTVQRSTCWVFVDRG